MQGRHQNLNEDLYKSDNEYDFEYMQARRFGMVKFLTGVRKIVVGSNLLVFLLFIIRIAEDVVIDIMSSNTKKLYLLSN